MKGVNHNVAAGGEPPRHPLPPSIFLYPGDRNSNRRGNLNSNCRLTLNNEYFYGFSLQAGFQYPMGL